MESIQSRSGAHPRLLRATHQLRDHTRITGRRSGRVGRARSPARPRPRRRRRWVCCTSHIRSSRARSLLLLSAHLLQRGRRRRGGKTYRPAQRAEAALARTCDYFHEHAGSLGAADPEPACQPRRAVGQGQHAADHAEGPDRLVLCQRSDALEQQRGPGHGLVRLRGRLSRARVRPRIAARPMSQRRNPAA